MRRSAWRFQPHAGTSASCTITAIVPLAHPDLRAFDRPSADAFERRVVSDETFVIPYGPVRSGVFESIQFVIETGGEDVLGIDVRPRFKHRGLERRFHGLGAQEAAFVAERIAGISSVAHAVAFAGGKCARGRAASARAAVADDSCRGRAGRPTTLTSPPGSPRIRHSRSALPASGSLRRTSSGSRVS